MRLTRVFLSVQVAAGLTADCRQLGNRARDEAASFRESFDTGISGRVSAIRQMEFHVSCLNLDYRSFRSDLDCFCMPTHRTRPCVPLGSPQLSGCMTRTGRNCTCLSRLVSTGYDNWTRHVML